MDWDTGATVHRTIFGKSNYGNGAYAILQFLPNGDLLFNSLVGRGFPRRPRASSSRPPVGRVGRAGSASRLAVGGATTVGPGRARAQGCTCCTCAV